MLSKPGFSFEMTFWKNNRNPLFFQNNGKKSKTKEVVLYGLLTTGSIALTAYFLNKNYSRKWVSTSLFFGLTGLRYTVTSLWSPSTPPKKRFTVKTLVDDPNELIPKTDPNAEDPKILKCIKEAIKLHGIEKSPPVSPSSPPCTKMGSVFKDFVEDLNEKADMKRFNCTNYNTTKQEYLKMFVEIMNIMKEADSRKLLAKQCLKDSQSDFINYDWVWVILVKYMTEIDLLNFSYAETVEEIQAFPDSMAAKSISFDRIKKAYRILIQGRVLNNCCYKAKALRDELRKYESDQ